VSQHIGDLETLETTAHWRRTLEAYTTFFGMEPRVIARDLHPGYVSTQLAAELAPSVERVLTVQHHHAHVAAVAAEHRATEPVIGVAFDGTGLGDDDKIWGAELLIADLTGYRRVGQLRYAPLPGGDLAVRTPWRTALGYLSLLPDTTATHAAFALAVDGVPKKEQELVMQQVERGINAPEASSMGRLFDAAAALLGVCCVAGFEGEAAMRLESLAAKRTGKELPFPFVATGERLVLDPLPLLLALGESLSRGADVAELAASFHESVAATTAAAVRRVAEDSAISTVVLSGGVFQNARLLVALRQRLQRAALRVLVARYLPPNDGAISYGQAAIAAALLEHDSAA
jgi:hydrogenase maturation protein HypF